MRVEGGTGTGREDKGTGGGMCVVRICCLYCALGFGLVLWSSRCSGVLHHLALACWVWRGEVGCGPGVCVKWRKVEAVAVDATAECFGPSASPVALPRGPAALLLHLQGRVGVEGSVRWGPTVARPAWLSRLTRISSRVASLSSNLCNCDPSCFWSCSYFANVSS